MVAAIVLQLGTAAEHSAVGYLSNTAANPEGRTAVQNIWFGFIVLTATIDQ
jgi:hypothetical protein